MTRMGRTAILIAFFAMAGAASWRVATQPPHDHSQDAREDQLAKRAERERTINILSQPSRMDDFPERDVYVVVKTVWDENLGTERVIAERESDGMLLCTMAKPGSKLVFGQRVTIGRYSYYRVEDSQDKAVFYVTMGDAEPKTK